MEIETIFIIIGVVFGSFFILMMLNMCYQRHRILRRYGNMREYGAYQQALYNQENPGFHHQPFSSDDFPSSHNHIHLDHLNHIHNHHGFHDPHIPNHSPDIPSYDPPTYSAPAFSNSDDT